MFGFGESVLVEDIAVISSVIPELLRNVFVSVVVSLNGPEDLLIGNSLPVDDGFMIDEYDIFGGSDIIASSSVCSLSMECEGSNGKM